jgi:hypothetical protein
VGFSAAGGDSKSAVALEGRPESGLKREGPDRQCTLNADLSECC